MAVRCDSHRGYSLELGNGQGWHLVATGAPNRLLEKLASILELQPYEGYSYPKLIFVCGKPVKEKREKQIDSLDTGGQEGLPTKGWKARKYPALRIWSHCEVADVICEMGPEENHDLDIIRMVQALYPVFERAQGSGGLSLHAALVERRGVGALLVAPANAGKSSCCRLLPPPWLARCDDQTLVVRSEQNHYLAHPCPTWSEYFQRKSAQRWMVEQHVPVSGIFFLQKAEVGEVVSVGHGEAAALIVQSAMQASKSGWVHLEGEEVRALRKKVFDNSCELTGAIPAFRLQVNLRGRFWEEIDKVL